MRYITAIIAILLADQGSKLAVRFFMQPGDRIYLIGKWFSLYYVKNEGTAFSMFSGNRWITVALTSVLIIVCLVFIISEARKGARGLAMLVTCIFSGGLSNLIDRLRMGYVTDMISCWNFAVFNVADIFITCGCILTVLHIMLDARKDMLS